MSSIKPCLNLLEVVLQDFQQEKRQLRAALYEQTRKVQELEVSNNSLNTAKAAALLVCSLS